jgi:hypothetical protein
MVKVGKRFGLWFEIQGPCVDEESMPPVLQAKTDSVFGRPLLQRPNPHLASGFIDSRVGCCPTTRRALSEDKGRHDSDSDV